ncbi:hypothetical protein MAPG_01876 [Magnaporthiopsis poae ATCC 64411]|uniref:4Fe-4S ferredoxin-type domain-containing protein n=1 Tax=Magnaporthiopsis poae (strain ATCC 64411 / 73-15) TaxID=644358 RepID=A0A0C4DPU8_MAGP6|nr:hypothetical protein MAPG_01876 [Magnaporthiopsis poae ATCC 64411]
MRFYIHHLLLAAVATQLPQALAQEAQGAGQHQALHVARSEALNNDKKCVQCGQMCPLGANFHAHGPVLRFLCEELPGQQTK